MKRAANRATFRCGQRSEPLVAAKKNFGKTNEYLLRRIEDSVCSRRATLESELSHHHYADQYQQLRFINNFTCVSGLLRSSAFAPLFVSSKAVTGRPP
jgi:hypothetical protein